jgi:glutaredoxin
MAEIIPPTVEILGKPDCHLCHEAKAVLQTLRASYSFSLREVDITTRADLLARHAGRDSRRFHQRSQSLQVSRRSETVHPRTAPGSVAALAPALDTGIVTRRTALSSVDASCLLDVTGNLCHQFID